ncbi:MAG: hypothetical protein A2Y62_09530 [Candidatus Fischerbacteria bacterium RBG_13_37_8]|uniref:Dipeptidyl-peptidase n=1 Tax=Candidatus Fischerbacteria bacterium RBG_13_37_8 TaxID=1817863 RepID=A0A1F5VL46_9BACT|nr:MAG: hypothetical protein A2Y62_09530 [Candidatus Fischerbacteria bacterium RBG_13_37_8]
MKRLILVAWILSSVMLCAEEGMYLIQQVPPKVIENMKARGFQLAADDIFSMKQPSLAQAIINFGGGTASFVSPKGLILTNHHVAFGAAQRQSSADSNIIENGFLAKSMLEEIPAPGYKALILEEVKDVSTQIFKGIKKDLPPQKIYKVTEKNIKEIIKKEEGKSGNYRCQVRYVYGGLHFYLYKFFEVRDIRIVYFPTRNIGEFGGEVDNWMWPRHTGDFSFMRAYVAPDGKSADYAKENIPYTPQRYLKFSARDLDENDFAIVTGYPGITRRHLISTEVDYYINYYYPEGVRLYKKWIDILEEDSKKDKDAEIKNAGNIKGISNSYKNYTGMNEGLQKLDLMAKKKKQEEELLDFLDAHPDLKAKYGDSLPSLMKLAEEEKSLKIKSRMLGIMQRASKLLSSAIDINKWSIEKQKKDIERDPDYMDRNIPDLKEQIELAQRSLYIPSDKKALAFFISESLKLSDPHKIAVLETMIKDKSENGVAEFVKNLYAHSKMVELEYRMKLFDMNRTELLKLNDSFIDFADELQKELDKLKDMQEIIDGKMLLVRPHYMEAVIKQHEGNIYPDANGTLRLSYGSITGYDVKDAITYLPQTTMKGIIEKDTGEWPFNVSDKIKSLYVKRDFDTYMDPELNDIAVNFLTNNYCTGGNSGSPIINKYGELIGTVFDINYESLLSDYYYLPDITRTISVDSRYILFVLDKIDNADNILQELEIVR